MRRGLLLLVSAVLVAMVSLAFLSACAKESTPQVFRTNISGEPATIDPNKASFASEITIAKQLFRGLLGFNQDLSLKPVVAREIPSLSNGGISDDGTTYTFKMRPGVTWSDGKRVTANDFEFGIKRMLSPEVASEYASFYFDIQGAEAYNGAGEKDEAAKKQLRDAVAVKAVDSTTLRITLAQPRPTFLSIMALWPAFATREDVIAKHGDQWTEAGNLIGNGPFILSEWVHQDHLTLKPNPNYWGDDKAKVDEVQIRMITDANAALTAYKNNELDMVGVPAGTERATLADPTLSKEILRFNELTTFAFQFNVTVPPFNNVKVRQAIATAIDRDTYIDKVRGGVGKPALSWIPPGMPGYDANLGQEYKFNVPRAKQLLAEAGYSDVSKLPAIKFQYADAANNRVVAQFLDAQMKENLGITITLEPMESRAFSQLINNEQETWALLGWGADYPDPDNWLPELFGTGATINHTLYSNKQFDDIATRAKKELDNAKRLQLWADAQKIVISEAPIATIFYRERFWLKKPAVTGLKHTSMDGAVPGDFFFAEVSLAK